MALGALLLTGRVPLAAAMTALIALQQARMSLNTAIHAANGLYEDALYYGDYRGFWRTISSVEVTDTRSAGDDAVDVDLTYTKSDGSTEDETRRIFLEPSGDDYRISGDEVR